MDEIFKSMNEASVYIRRPTSNVEMTTLSDSPLLFLFVCLFFSVIMIKKSILCPFRDSQSKTSSEYERIMLNFSANHNWTEKTNLQHI